MGWLPSTHGGGVRSSSSNFLTPTVLERPNLHLLTDVHVTRLIFENESENAEPVVKGVEFVIRDAEGLRLASLNLERVIH